MPAPPDLPAAAAAIELFLKAIGHDPVHHPALVGTGARVASLFVDDLLDGHRADLDALFAAPIAAPDDAPLVIVDRLETHVVCPHHLTVATGYATVAYLPGGRVLGLGALPSLVDAFAHRLALQEDVGRDVAHALVERLGARGAACALDLRHGCLALHGARKMHARVRTVSLAGSFAAAGPDRDLALASLRRGG